MAKYFDEKIPDIHGLIERTQRILRNIQKYRNGDGDMLRRNTIPELVRLISSSLLLQRSKSSVSQYGFIYNGKIIKVRVSSHPANGEKLDNPNADDVISIVIYKDGEHRGEYGN